jgi:copper transport protein
MDQVSRRLLVLAMALALLLFAAPSASAHAVLLRADPEIGGVTPTPPAELLLQFSEPVEPRFSTIVVTDKNGDNVTRGKVSTGDDNSSLVTALQPGLKDGWYRVEWRVLSIDGHRIRGVFQFGVGHPGPAPAIGALAGGGASFGSIVLRWVTLMSLILASGLAVFRLLIVRAGDGGSKRALWQMEGILLGLIIVALVATPLYVAHETALFGYKSLLDVGWIAENLRSTAFGRGYTDLIAIIGLFAGLTVLALRTGRRWLGVLAVAAGISTLLIPGLVGHPGQGSIPALAVPLDWLHLAGAAAWGGGLLGLALIGRDAATRIAPRFSNLALLSVVALAWTGVIAALENVKSIENLTSTGYGQSLIVKSALLLAAMPLAAMNLRSSRAGRKLKIPFVRGELSLVTVIVIAAAVLTTLPPPGRGATTQVATNGEPLAVQTGPTATTDNVAAEETPGGPVAPPTLNVGPGPIDSALQKAPPYLSVFSLDPNDPGRPNEVRVLVSRADEPISGARVTASFRFADLTGTVPVKTVLLPQTAVGVYAAKTDALLKAGTWVVTVNVEGTGETVPRMRYRVTVAPPP